MPDDIQEIADRLERAADRYHHAADFRSKTDALNAAAQARRARSLLEAQQIEQAFLRSHPPDGAGPNPALSDNAGCLPAWLGGASHRRTTPWRSSTAFRPGMIRSNFMSGRYHSYTVRDAIARHVPPGYHHPNHYPAHIANTIGVPEAALLSALTAAQVAAIADAIERDPHWQSAPLGEAATGAATTTDARHSPSPDFAPPHPDNYGNATNTESNTPSQDFAPAPTDNS